MGTALIDLKKFGETLLRWRFFLWFGYGMSGLIVLGGAYLLWQVSWKIPAGIVACVIGWGLAHDAKRAWLARSAKKEMPAVEPSTWHHPPQDGGNTLVSD